MKLEIVGEKSPRPRQGQGFVNYIFMPCGYGSENISDPPKKIDNGTISPLSTPLQAVTIAPAVLNRIGA